MLMCYYHREAETEACKWEVGEGQTGAGDTGETKQKEDGPLQAF